MRIMGLLLLSFRESYLVWGRAVSNGELHR